MNFVSNIIWNSVEGFVEAGTRTAGGYAGDALLKAGDLVEGAGRSVGTGIERTASGYGSKISGGAPAPTIANKPAAVKRSHSSPASSKAATRGPTSKTPLGANKYPGGRQITAGAKSTVGGAQKTVGGVRSGAQRAIGGVGQKTIGGVGGAQKAIGSVAKTNPLPKAYPNNVPYGTSVKPSSATKTTPISTNLSTPYPGTSTLPSANNTGKKTAVRPGGAPKPFNPTNTLAGAKTGPDEKKPYPGTNTLPGQAGKTPVRKYKPLERMKPVAEKGKMQHFAV